MTVLCLLPMETLCDECSQFNYPEITFTYNWASRIIDTIGGFYFGAKVTAERREQLQKQLPDFVAAWKQNASLFFDEIFAVFKRGFKDQKRTAITYLSHNSSYGDHRFLIFGLRYHLDPEPWLEPVSRGDGFTDLVFHELLHVWVDENINKDTSPLLAKYHKEDCQTKEHLHLMALQKMVYLKINRPDLLSMIDDGYRHKSWDSYRRAWEIVNDIEGHEAVLHDIALSLYSVPI